MTGATIVNSWNEWDPLKHVIVGRATGTMVQAPEPAVRRDWPDEGYPPTSSRSGESGSIGPP